MASPSGARYNFSILTNYINVHLSFGKLNGTNYDTWASNMKLWLKGQNYADLH